MSSTPNPGSWAEADSCMYYQDKKKLYGRSFFKASKGKNIKIINNNH
jgi:hypothetical protein